jgi:glyoxylase-like metal-dependent hydrolase (beta-lactamase superfamily II)
LTYDRGVTDIRRLDLGYFVRPASETDGAEPRVEPVLAYLVRRDDGVLLFVTGLGEGEPSVDAHYLPHRLDLEAALHGAGLSTQDITLVANCHLHFDHCGGNPRFTAPILAQSSELALARGEEYTLPWLVDFPGATYRELAGEAEIWPGVWVIPTPGHTAGHQSLVVQRPDGTVVLAGQAHDFSTGYSSAVLARRAARADIHVPPWLDRIMQFDPRRVLFAHDNAVWEPA